MPESAERLGFKALLYHILAEGRLVRYLVALSLHFFSYKIKIVTVAASLDVVRVK